ncbi:unnamed protein product [Hyaloperonospora brassicae]|uniref:RNA polymerase II-associated protein 3 n=1 Tax=Hyaloperonospora brassicae TaxID=162125 RepID=A0AAV0UDT8_HYABA|nr:unnamed protein product [Hyaloperonospora brassicae]
MNSEMPQHEHCATTSAAQDKRSPRSARKATSHTDDLVHKRSAETVGTAAVARAGGSKRYASECADGARATTGGRESIATASEQTRESCGDLDGDKECRKGDDSSVCELKSSRSSAERRAVQSVHQVVATSLKEATGATTDSRQEVEKRDGNERYARGEYAAAIESYTRCLDCNLQNAVVLSNRAMAYLKNQEFVKAEDDCTSALKIDPTHVKSYTRRGTARNALGKHRLALLDFHHAATLDPRSRQIQAQLQSTRELLRTAIKRSPKRTGFAIEVASGSGPGHACKPKRATSEEKNCGLQQPTRSSSGTKRDSSISQESSASRLAQDGTLRATSSTKGPTKRPMILPKLPNNAPATSYEFNRVWKTFALRGDADQKSQRLNLRADYLRMIDPATLCSVFKTSIESDVLCDVFRVFRHVLLSSSKVSSFAHVGAASFVLAFASELTNVTRFDMTVMLLSENEKADIAWVIQHLEGLAKNDNDIQEHAVADLTKLYKLQ